MAIISSLLFLNFFKLIQIQPLSVVKGTRQYIALM